MKLQPYRILFIVLVLTANLANAQFRKIPAEVTNAFAAKFPDATNIEWKDQLVDYKVYFDEDGNNYVAKFDNQGLWIITEQIINQEGLPTGVKNGLSMSLYSDWEVRYVSIVDKPENNKQYRITVAKNSINKKDLLFSSEGKLLKNNFTF